jgi:dTDP-4-dehydrorhamnose 3,5-epimerase
MPFRFTRAAIPDVMIIEPPVVADERGFFMETYKHSEFAGRGIAETFVQCNHSKSERGVLRGLHYQKHPKAQAKLVRAVSGAIYDVVVDLRSGGPTYGQWFAATLSAENRKMLYVPRGFAHGFCVISTAAEIFYMTTAEYAPELEAGVIWNDSELAIEWPIAEPVLSARDRAWPALKDAENDFRYGAAEGREQRA